MARHYTLPPTEYDYDEIFNQQEENEAQLQLLNDPHIVKYRTKTIKSGNFLEVEVYPIWDTRSATARARRTKESREAQKRLNYKNATKNVIRLINANFTDSDFWGTFTYESRKLPKSLPDAQKEMSKFIRRLKYYAEKHDFPPLKYIYVIDSDKLPDYKSFLKLFDLADGEYLTSLTDKIKYVFEIALQGATANSKNL